MASRYIQIETGALALLKRLGNAAGFLQEAATGVIHYYDVFAATTRALVTEDSAQTLTNKLGVIITKHVLFTENATNTVHTGSVTIPVGAFVHDVKVTNQALWGAASAALDVGDAADPNGIFAAVDCKATDLVLGEILSAMHSTLWGGKEGAYLVAATGRRGPQSTNFSMFYAAGGVISGIMTVGTPGATTGRTIMSVSYSVGEVSAAVPSA
jgi:hypothetical protein